MILPGGAASSDRSERIGNLSLIRRDPSGRSVPGLRVIGALSANSRHLEIQRQ
ncbi:MAG: hypothetical protein KGN36_00685 [Acidobacteriota bacterium]|nr:hypothetical protein [Acidobacteriota bacterium]